METPSALAGVDRMRRGRGRPPRVPYARRMDFLQIAFALFIFFATISVIGVLRRIAAATEEIARNTRDRAGVDPSQ